jgi:uncharacterized Zn finger protein
MHEAAKNWRFPLQCPQCGKGTAIPERIETNTPELLAIRISCRNCGHHWQLESDNPPVIAYPKPDGRSKGGGTGT